MGLINAIILGIIQGVTEFLPISSSVHISFYSYFSGISSHINGLTFAMLHIGTLIAIIVTYYRTIYDLFSEFVLVIKEIFKRQFVFDYKNMTETRKLLFMLMLSCLPLLLLLLPIGNGARLVDFFRSLYSDDSIRTEAIFLMLSGFYLLVTSFVTEQNERFKKIKPKSAFLIGVSQLLAVCLPGVSLSGVTVSTALMCGMSKKSAINYSFLLSVPTVVAFSFIEFKSVVTGDTVVSVFPILAGTIISAVIGLLSIKLLKVLINKDWFKYFGFYCLGIGFVVTIISAVQTFTK